ncbi:MAG TPA: iron-containing alcohol dehydrogenase [Noviherbaspirillum sp.]|jgi:maleylacetate reductase|uniref:iron-containing alcohol dehydrogenase n=1 Tax=Noviherbaspirillum sp. TaxID=1926288 RepID=UPI002DDD7F1E|nr:iron-containing alcohol dehydrogenase [Noviherbaspirillum sp.]HEV2611912.1 iron-containing alcohol dehydrogenase [Noviherbaspirillum sp.]
MQSGIYTYPGTGRVIYGIDFAQAIADEVERVDARRVFVLAGGTLARETDVVRRMKAALGDRFAGLHAGIGAHTPRSDVVAAANAARAVSADLLLTVGGGSITDAAKMVCICLGNDITDPAQLDALRTITDADGKTVRPSFIPPSVASVVIPTTLSAGEFSAAAGCTDTERQVKESYFHPQAIPRTVILDPAVTLHTPEWLWLSTGVRAIDHAVEDLCAINSKPFSDATSYHALRLLGSGLRACKADPSNLAARLDCQLGAWMSIIGTSAGVTKGASHGIGHVLGGTGGVPHGYTSCVMLPHVLRFNFPVNAERQAWVSEALGRRGEPAADVVATLIAELGMPQTLRDVGLKEDLLDLIAQNAMHDRLIHTNPRKIDGPATVRQLLDAAW